MISGRAFSDVCKWVVDPRYPSRIPFQYSEASPGDWVFVNGDYLRTFLTAIPFRGSKRFVLVVHNTDRPFGQAELDAVRPHILHVFAVNAAIKHPRVTPIPLGFADNQLDFLSSFHPTSGERDIEVYLNITARHNWEKRKACIDAFAADSRVVHRDRVSVPEYYADLCRSKFVLCPEGTGMDTHRVYESLLCGATPVVLRNSLSPLYEALPVCIVDKWTDPFYVPTNKTFPMSVHDYLRQ